MAGPSASQGASGRVAARSGAPAHRAGRRRVAAGRFSSWLQVGSRPRRPNGRPASRPGRSRGAPTLRPAAAATHADRPDGEGPRGAHEEHTLPGPRIRPWRSLPAGLRRCCSVVSLAAARRISWPPAAASSRPDRAGHRDRTPRLSAVGTQRPEQPPHGTGRGCAPAQSAPSCRVVTVGRRQPGPSARHVCERQATGLADAALPLPADVPHSWRQHEARVAPSEGALGPGSPIPGALQDPSQAVPGGHSIPGTAHCDLRGRLPVAWLP